MPLTSDDLRYHYSGGAANTLPANSLGGAISTTRISSQTVSTPTVVTGVTITAAFNNAPGVGILQWSSATSTLSWQPPSSVTAYSVVVTAPGSYLVGGSDGTLVVTTGAMPTSFKTENLTVAYASANVFDSVSPGDSLVGRVEYRCIYIKNNNGTLTAPDARVWVKSLTTGPDEIDIGVDPAGVGDGTTTGVAVVIGTDLTAPAGVVFSRPLSYSTGLALGDLTAGNCAAIWERRTVPPNTTGDVTNNTSTIAVAITV